jgi:MYXO-CTERM domain-containing protein
MGGEIAPFTYFVGEAWEIVCEDFEASDGGYQHELVTGTVADGADDWQWGSPEGFAFDPAAAYSGDNVWGNDLGLGFGANPSNGEYQADKFNRLYSPQLDSLWYTDVFLQYRRWLNVEDGVYDQAVITIDGDEVWSNWPGTTAGGEFTQDRTWMSHAVDLKRKGDQTRFELAWELHSDQALTFGGWNIDDVCIFAPATPDNRLAIVDFQVEDQGGPIALSWTNPEHLPVERVVVTRRTDQYPAAWDDGDVLIDIAGPVPGEFTEAVHGNGDGQSGYYAVYAYDGTDWLSWTIEGWNAAHADPNDGGDDQTGTITTDGSINTDPSVTSGTTTTGGDTVPDVDDTDTKPPGGCVCDASGTPAVGFAWPLLGLALIARRRRARG